MWGRAWKPRERMQTAHSTCEDHICTSLIRAGPQMPLFHFGPLTKEEPSSALHTEPSSTSLPDQVCGMLLPSHNCLSHRCRFERTCIPGADSPRAKCVTLSNLHLLLPHLSSFSNVPKVQVQSQRCSQMHKLLLLGSLSVGIWGLGWKEAMIYPKAFLSKENCKYRNREVEEMFLSVGKGSLSSP